MRKTLAGQIAICILCFLTPLFFIDEGFVIIFALFIPLIVFYFLFRKIKSGKGYEFKTKRIIIASLLWVLSLTGFLVFSCDIIALFFSKWLKYWFEWSTAFFAVFVIYSTIALAIVVILSYVIGKWINSKTNGNPSD